MVTKRIVLDTNVCLDLFVFRDTRWNALLTALKQGQLQAVTREDCRNEWLAVLHYSHLPLDEITRPQATLEFDALIQPVAALNIAPQSVVTQLPICSDPDDQKFLELAHESNAEMLITKDKALLKLARKTARAGLFGIITPEAWQPHV